MSVSASPPPKAPFASSDSVKKRQWLAEDFTPSDYHVLVGRGKVCYRHAGNQHLVKVVKSFLPEYSAANSTKKAKSLVIKKIVGQIRSRGTDKDVDFIKFDDDANQWYIVDERTAREKVSQSKLIVDTAYNT